MKEVKIYIPSSTEFVGPVVKFLYDFFSNKEIQETIAANVVTSVIEAVGNAVVHGNQEDYTKNVAILIRINKNTLKIEVQDQGKGFDTERLPDPLAPENILKPCGRGIFLIKNFMDNVTFDFNGSGSRLTMEKTFENDLE